MIRDDLTKIELPPGLVRLGTQYEVKGRWYACNRVRWVGGQLKPIGGSQRLSTSALTGKVRALLSWADSDGDKWIAAGASDGLFIAHADGASFTDITPAGFISGTDDAEETTGYGGGNYGAGTYGTPREGGIFSPLALWSFDLWGEQLAACERGDGKLYLWDLNTANDAAQMTNSPENCLGVMVTDQRHVMALGAEGDGRLVKWSDKEDATLWTPAADNEAGSLILNTQSAIQAGVRVGGTNLLVTRTDAHAVDYIGSPFYYGRRRVGKDCGTPSPKSVVVAGERAYWIGDGSFWVSDGSSVAPLVCDVHDRVFGTVSDVLAEKVHGGVNPKFKEIWWFLPISGGNEPNRYVIYNYDEKWWAEGLMTRTAWDAGSILGDPHSMDEDNNLVRQETGDDDSGTAIDHYAESGVLEMGVGARVANVDQGIVDEGVPGQMTYTFRARFTPQGEEFTYGPFTARSDGFIDARFSGRQAVMRVVPSAEGDFTLGTLRLNVTPGGAR